MLQIDRRFPAEHGNDYAHSLFSGINFFNRSQESFKRSVDHLDGVADFKAFNDLMALASDPAASDNEASLAYERAQRLIDRYRLEDWRRDRTRRVMTERSVPLAARGWTTSGGDVFETVQRMTKAGCERFVVTDVASDGMLTGPNLELLGAVCARTTGRVVASGGISSLHDLKMLSGLVPIGVEGAIIGTALYVGNFTLTEALAVVRDPVMS